MKKNILSIFCFSVLILPNLVLAGIEIPEAANSLPRSDLLAVVIGILRWLLGVFGILAIISFVVSGIMYLASAGDDSMAEKAKKAMTYSVIGVVVGLSAFVVIQAVDSMLRVSSPRF